MVPRKFDNFYACAFDVARIKISVRFIFTHALCVDVSMEVTAAQLRKLRVVDLRKRLQSLELTQSGEN